ncbi:acyl-CoA dehydrogenase family protein [Burkholderia sp. 22PA0099]|uniref:acyl-CoA dehydrogenase family protein n=1 Tax=Burkholderia sp. 22PA0099 TaxID=3237372 RepID=UPI0039C3F483
MNEIRPEQARRLDAEPPIPVPVELAALHDAVRALGASLAEASAQADRERILPFDAMRALRDTRLTALRVPSEFGGAGAGWREVAAVFVTLAKGDPNVAQAFLAHFVFVERLRLMGSAAQHRRLLPLAAAGVLFGGAAAERGGQFRGEMQTRLVRDGSHFVLDGVKHYSTGALYADVLKIRALDEAGEMVAALVPADRAGIERIDDWDGMGQRGSASGTTRLHRVTVQAGEVMRMAPWTARPHHTGAAAQLLHAAIEIGIGLAALDDAAAWARHRARPVRESGVASASQDPYVLQTVGRMAASVHAAEAMVDEAARVLDIAAEARFGAAAEADVHDTAIAASIAVAQAKIVSTEAALDVTERMYDAGGAAMTLRADNFDRHWRNARTHTTHDPLAYKCRAVGNHVVNGAAPPLTFSY